jgi:hypothetical protein
MPEPSQDGRPGMAEPLARMGLFTGRREAGASLSSKGHRGTATREADRLAQ